jgi:hypothetical protein
VTRVRDATEFSIQLRRAREDYERIYRPRVEEVRAQFASNDSGQESPDVDDALEAHVRQYLINALLNALNWRLDRRPDQGLETITIPEAPIKPSGTGNTRFLDYLGTDGSEGRALLVVETKRPNSSLLSRIRKYNRYADETLPQLIAAALEGKADVGKEWQEWLETLRDYARRVRDQSSQPPRRVVLTNGSWLIIFTDPDNSFLQGGTPDDRRILVYEKLEEIETRPGEAFRWLEHQQVLDEVPPLNVASIAFYVRPESLIHAMHGLRVLYAEQESLFAVSPVVHLSPVLFLHSIHGAWLQVKSEIEYALPHEAEKHPEHLNQIYRVATGLLADVNARLRTRLVCLPLEEHYEDESSFRVLPGVIKKRVPGGHRRWEYLVVTGEHTHYLLPEPTVKGCRYHDWSVSSREGHAATPVPITRRSTDPRSFFFTPELHHCTHREVDATKAGPITPENRDLCGLRSGDDYEAFCEIAPFERHLCCRACVFQRVCAKASVFHLPCSDAAAVHQPENT